jgi:hypothetical protein
LLREYVPKDFAGCLAGLNQRNMPEYLGWAMLTKRTVLVLGAGASVPFEFPTGAKLSRYIIDGCEKNSPPFELLRNLGRFSQEEIDRFRDCFFLSGKNSIDAFLEHRSEFLPIGKAAIALTLIPYERTQRIFTYNEDNWLRYVFDQLNTSFEEFGKNALSIVTFNYDRVVEHFFFTALKNSYGRSDAECIEVLNHIPIIHLHGRLGCLPWQGEGGRPFHYEADEQSLRVSIDNLKIIHEDIKDGRDEDFTAAKQLLADAEQIYFLGFSFNRTNVERLDIKKFAGKSMATAFGMKRQEILTATRIAGQLNFQEDVDCIGLCRKIIDWS